MGVARAVCYATLVGLTLATPSFAAGQPYELIVRYPGNPAQIVRRVYLSAARCESAKTSIKRQNADEQEQQRVNAARMGIILGPAPISVLCIPT